MNIGGIGYTGSVMRNMGMKPKNSSASETNPTVPKFDIAAYSSANNSVSTLTQTALKNASQEVQDAWKKAEEKNSGVNPLTDADGKIVGSSLFARYMEMEYNLMLRYGAKEARIRMDNVFADKDSARSLVSASLERATNPLTRAKSSEQLELEKRFLDFFYRTLVDVDGQRIRF